MIWLPHPSCLNTFSSSIGLPSNRNLLDFGTKHDGGNLSSNLRYEEEFH